MIALRMKMMIVVVVVGLLQMYRQNRNNHYYYFHLPRLMRIVLLWKMHHSYCDVIADMFVDNVGGDISAAS